MPMFQYEAMNSVGQAVKDEIDAASSEEAIAKIRSLGYFPTKVKEKAARTGKAGGAAVTRARTSAGRPRRVGRVGRKVLTQFTRQLATLQDAGLPILRSLRILEQQQKPGSMRIAIRLVADDVEGGATLSEAMAKYPKAFDRLYTNMIQAGEAGGVLELVLIELADFLERAQALRRKVVGAMIYPVAVIFFAVLILIGLMKYVIPQFGKIFDDFDADIPAITVALIETSNWMARTGWIVVLSIPIGIYALFQLLKVSQGGRYFVDNLKLNIPIFGRIVAKTSVARFSRTLGVLLGAGVPILEALNITRDTAGNEVYARALNHVHDAIREGENFSSPLRQARVVEPMVVNMIDVGEETGELDKMLLKIADTYDEEVETLVASMVSLLEPLLIIVLGVIVGIIVVALFAPLPALIEAAQQRG